VVLLYEFSFFGRPDRRLFSTLTPILLTVCIIPFTMLSLHKPIGEILSDVSKATVVQTSLSRWEYLCTQFSVIVTYLRLLVLPVNQNLDYDYPINHSLLGPRAFLSLLLLLALFCLAVWLWRKSTMTRDQGPGTGNSEAVPPILPDSRLQVSGLRSQVPEFRLAAFGILWFFITLAVESSIIPIIDVIFEHRVYLPSPGVFIAVVSLLLMGAERLRTRHPKACMAMMLLIAGSVLVLSGVAYARNTVWQSEVTLWQDVTKKSPVKARGYKNLGMHYAFRGEIENAIREYETALKLDPLCVDTHFNLAQQYALAGRLPEAAREYRIALRMNPEDTESRETLRRIEKIMNSDEAGSTRATQGKQE
jgi:hypothetical protein